MSYNNIQFELQSNINSIKMSDINDDEYRRIDVAPRR